jgi:hypothetical protein
MAAATHDITIEQGATWRLVLSWMQPDGVTAYDLTGCQARMQVRSAHGTDVLIDLDEAGTDDGQISLGGATGSIAIRIAPSATEKLNVKKAQYDLVLQLATGDVERLLRGKVTVVPSITEPTYG